MEKKLKIIALSFLFPNRAYPNHGIFVLNRLKALSKYVDIKVINPIPWSPVHKYIDRYKAFESVPEKDSIDGIEVYHPRYLSIPKFFKGVEVNSYIKAIEPVVKDIIKKHDFDIIDMHWTFPDLPAGLFISNKYNMKSIVTLRGVEAFHFQDNDLREKIVKEGLIGVDRIIALSNQLLKLGENASNNQNKSHVIINGVDTDKFYYMPLQECRRELDLDQKEKIILSVGSLVKGKGFDILISALSSMRNETDMKNLKLYIIGSHGQAGDYRKKLFEQVKDLNLEKNVIFLGQVDNDKLKYWYNAADLFCLSSRSEGSPNVLSEALACGCPSVSSDVGSARDIVDIAGGSSVCMDDLSVDSLVSSLSNVLNKNSNRLDDAEKYSNFNWDWCAKKVFKVYNQCIKN